MKLCNKCSREKEDFEFSKRGKKGLQPYCKECTKEYDREYWKKNKHIRRAKKRVNSKIICDRNRKFMYNYLLENPCVDCGENDPVVLDFDHLRDKKKTISNMTGYSLETLVEEIKKCEVRCSNCHRRKTAKEFGWYKDL